MTITVRDAFLGRAKSCDRTDLGWGIELSKNRGEMLGNAHIPGKKARVIRDR